MALDSTASLSAAELAIYVALTPLVLFFLVRHRLPGLLGWLYLQIFCVLRLVAAGIQISSRHTPVSRTGAVIDSIGISPLLLALAGILHEAAHYLTEQRHRSITFLTQALFHVLTATGVALAAIGGSHLASPETDGNHGSTDHTQQEIGAVLLFLVWMMLCLFAFMTYRQASAYAALDQVKLRNPGKLLLCAVGSLLLVGIRAAYGITYAFDHSTSVSPVTGKFAIKLVFIFLVPLLTTLSLALGGFVTRNLANPKNRAGHTLPPPEYSHGTVGSGSRAHSTSPRGASVPLDGAYEMR